MLASDESMHLHHCYNHSISPTHAMCWLGRGRENASGRDKAQARSNRMPLAENQLPRCEHQLKQFIRQQVLHASFIGKLQSFSPVTQALACARWCALAALAAVVSDAQPDITNPLLPATMQHLVCMAFWQCGSSWDALQHWVHATLIGQQRRLMRLLCIAGLEGPATWLEGRAHSRLRHASLLQHVHVRHLSIWKYWLNIQIEEVDLLSRPTLS